jgi:hypothetical protein
LREVADMKMFRYVFVVVASSADVKAVANQLDVGDVESIDEAGRQIVVRLSEAKIPQVSDP